jgi:hypothetical protein
MEANEVQPYIEHRMKCVGWDGNPAFDQRVFAEIFKATGGIPRRINQIVNRLLLLGAVDQRTRIDGVMLQMVLSEFTDDGTLALVRPMPKAPYAPEPVAAPIAAEPAEIAPTVEIESALAERDAQIAELQQAVLELANAADEASAAPAPEPAIDHGDEIAALNDRIAALEGRLVEQDRTIRHTLTMLIEWIEADEGQRAAA